MSILKVIGSWKIWAIIAAMFGVLFAFLKVERYKNKKLKKENDNLEDEMKQNQYDSEVKNVNVKNEMAYEMAKEKENEDDTNSDDMSKSYST